MEVTNACINILRPVLFGWSIHDDLKKIKYYKFIFSKMNVKILNAFGSLIFLTLFLVTSILVMIGPLSAVIR